MTEPITQEQSTEEESSPKIFKDDFDKVAQSWALRYGRYNQEFERRSTKELEKFRKEVRRRMKLYSLSAEDLALRVGASSRMLYKFFNGETLPRLQTAMKIAAVLNLKIPEVVAPKV